MKKITFVPRNVAAKMKPPGRAVLISIHDKSETELRVQPGWVDVLYLRFHDTDGQTMGLEVFSAVQAQSALDFVRKYGDDVDELVVHCQAGQSRSAGAALCFSEMMGIPCFKESAPVSTHRYNIYNRKVFGTLLRVASDEPEQAFLTWCGMV